MPSKISEIYINIYCWYWADPSNIINLFDFTFLDICKLLLSFWYLLRTVSNTRLRHFQAIFVLTKWSELSSLSCSSPWLCPCPLPMSTSYGPLPISYVCIIYNIFYDRWSALMITVVGFSCTFDCMPAVAVVVIVFTHECIILYPTWQIRVDPI